MHCRLQLSRMRYFGACSKSIEISYRAPIGLPSIIANPPSGTSRSQVAFSRRNAVRSSSPRQLIEPHKGDKRYVRRKKGKFTTKQGVSAARSPLITAQRRREW
jgi:hypothetical protein